MSLTDMNAQKSKNLRIMQLSAVGILLNVLPSLLVSKLGLPLYLDSIGTILSAAAGGIVPGTIAAFLTNLIKGFWDLSSVYYIPINILLALLTAFLAPRKMLTRFPGMLLAVICFALAGGVIGGVLTWYLNGSVFGGSVLSSRLLESGFSPFLAQIGGDFLYDLADKAISLAAVILLLRMLPQHFVDSFSSDSLSLILGQVKVRKLSLHTKVMLLIAGLMLFVGIAVTGITLSLFHNSIIRVPTASTTSMSIRSGRTAAMSCLTPTRRPDRAMIPATSSHSTRRFSVFWTRCSRAARLTPSSPMRSMAGF